jgi:hypothetical protein
VIKVRRKRRSTPANPFKVFVTHWRDPYPWIPGTRPEKMIFAALVQRRIYFRFQFDLEPEEYQKGTGLIAPTYVKPDFIIPEYKVIVDPFSPFHHGLAEAIERDVRKKLLYADILGYEFATPDSDEVEKKGGLRILAEISRLNRAPTVELTDAEDIRAKRSPGWRLGPNIGIGASSVGAANRKRRRSTGTRTLRTSR